MAAGGAAVKNASYGPATNPINLEEDACDVFELMIQLSNVLFTVPASMRDDSLLHHESRSPALVNDIIRAAMEAKEAGGNTSDGDLPASSPPRPAEAGGRHQTRRPSHGSLLDSPEARGNREQSRLIAAANQSAPAPAPPVTRPADGSAVVPLPHVTDHNAAVATEHHGPQVVDLSAAARGTPAAATAARKEPAPEDARAALGTVGYQIHGLPSEEPSSDSELSTAAVEDTAANRLDDRALELRDALPPPPPLQAPAAAEGLETRAGGQRTMSRLVSDAFLPDLRSAWDQALASSSLEPVEKWTEDYERSHGGSAVPSADASLDRHTSPERQMRRSRRPSVGLNSLSFDDTELAGTVADPISTNEALLPLQSDLEITAELVRQQHKLAFEELTSSEPSPATSRCQSRPGSAGSGVFVSTTDGLGGSSPPRQYAPPEQSLQRRAPGSPARRAQAHHHQGGDIAGGMLKDPYEDERQARSARNLMQFEASISRSREVHHPPTQNVTEGPRSAEMVSRQTPGHTEGGDDRRVVPSVAIDVELPEVEIPSMPGVEEEEEDSLQRMLPPPEFRRSRTASASALEVASAQPAADHVRTLASSSSASDLPTGRGSRANSFGGIDLTAFIRHELKEEDVEPPTTAAPTQDSPIGSSAPQHAQHSWRPEETFDTEAAEEFSDDGTTV